MDVQFLLLSSDNTLVGIQITWAEVFKLYRPPLALIQGARQGAQNPHAAEILQSDTFRRRYPPDAGALAKYFIILSKEGGETRPILCLHWLGPTLERFSLGNQAILISNLGEHLHDFVLVSYLPCLNFKRSASVLRSPGHRLQIMRIHSEVVLKLYISAKGFLGAQKPISSSSSENKLGTSNFCIYSCKVGPAHRGIDSRKLWKSLCCLLLVDGVTDA